MLNQIDSSFHLVFQLVYVHTHLTPSFLIALTSVEAKIQLELFKFACLNSFNLKGKIVHFNEAG